MCRYVRLKGYGLTGFYDKISSVSVGEDFDRFSKC